MTDRKGNKGVSLAKGPVGLIGLALLAYGVTAFIFGGHSFSAHPISGTVNGKTWLGLEVNAWSSLLFIGAGALLLFGSPLHWAAKSLALIVGLALGAASLIALYDKQDVFGIFAANGLTKLVWGAAGALLILLSLLPRVGAEKHDAAGDDRARSHRRVERQPRTVERQPTHQRTTRTERQAPRARDSPQGRREGGSVVATASGTTPHSGDTTGGQRNA